MIVNFADQGTEDVFNGKNSSCARKQCPKQIWNVAFRKLDHMDTAEELVDLATPPGNCLEALSANRKGQHSIRINNQFRICSIWTRSGPMNVEITDYH